MKSALPLPPRDIIARALRAALLFGILAVAAPMALAMPIQFDPDGLAPGNGTLNVASIDFLPGNTLFKNIGSLLVNKTGQPVTVYTQTRIGALLDGNGQQLVVNGLNTIFELTLVLGFSATGTVDNVVTPTHPFPTTTITLDANGPVNFAELWYDNSPDADDLAGTGFNDGVQILGGQFLTANGGVFRFVDTPLFDNFGPDNYGGLLTRHVVGGGDYKVDVLGGHGAFFTGAPSQIDIQLLNESEVTPFSQVNPSQRFYDGIGPNIIPLLGALNGDSSDFQMQSDANASFTPEPSSFVLGAFGALGILAGLRRRKQA